MKITLSIFLLSLILISCNSGVKNKKEEKDYTSNEVHKMIKMNCYTCHNPNSESHDAILAPPFIAVKRRYKMEFDNKEEFVRAMSEFTYVPSIDTYLMKGAVNKFGLMPRTALSKKQLEFVAEYIWENDLEEPEWFQEHFEEEHGEVENSGTK